MSLRDTLVGGGLSFASASAGLIYGDWRARRQARDAQAEQRRTRQRDLLIDAQAVVIRLSGVLTDMALNGGAGKDTAAELNQATTALGAVASRVERSSARELMLELIKTARHEPFTMDAAKAGTLGEQSGRLMMMLGEAIQTLDA